VTAAAARGSKTNRAGRDADMNNPCGGRGEKRGCQWMGQRN
jgi:hypothetical protein